MNWHLKGDGRRAKTVSIKRTKVALPIFFFDPQGTTQLSAHYFHTSIRQENLSKPQRLNRGLADQLKIPDFF